MSFDASASWIPGDDDFMDYAKGDMVFAEWCRRVDGYSRRFLNMSFLEFENVHDPVTDYCESRSPMWFLRHVLVPALVCDMGCDFVEELIAEQVLWGCVKGAAR